MAAAWETSSTRQSVLTGCKRFSASMNRYRLTGSPLREEAGGLLEDLALLLEHAHPLAQSHDLFVLGGGGAGASAFIYFCLRYPAPDHRFHQIHILQRSGPCCDRPVSRGPPPRP